MDHNVNLLIFTIFGEKDRWKAILIMILLPTLISYLTYYKNKIYNFFFSKSSITLSIKIDKDGKLVNSNPSYSSVCWYLESFPNVNIRQLVCEEHQSKANEKVGNTNKKVPIFIPSSSFDILHNKSSIRISFYSSSSSKGIVLTSNNLDNIKEFINEANEKFLNYFHSQLDTKEVYLCQWKLDKYRADLASFDYKKISVNKTFSNVYLGKDTIEQIKKDIDTFLVQKEYYKTKGIPHKRGYLLYGPPGTGKNSLVYAVSREYKMNIYKIDFKSDANSVKNIIQKIPPHSILFIDELDMLIYNDRTKIESKVAENDDDDDDYGEKRKSHNSCSGKFPLSALMDILDGYDYLEDCLVFCTTNHKEVLDPSLIRPGRIDVHFFLDKLDSTDIQKTIKSFTDFDIQVPKQVTMTSSVLINRILLPNNQNKERIQELISNFV